MMVWFWGGSNQNDSAKSLDADLKQFLKEQQPRPYQPAEAPVKEVEEPKRPAQAQSIPDGATKPEDRPLPKESLYQDGRYKDIWKTYVPPSEVASIATSPIESMINARKDRRTSIHRASLENCAFENDLKRLCLGGGFSSTIKSRMTMCAAETKTFNRCYQLQAKFLQALGYMASSKTTDDYEERIQMHADKLYHRMMDYEEALEHARLNNEPIPPLASIFDPRRPAPAVEQYKLPENVAKRLKTPLTDLPPHERELAVIAATQEAKFTNEHAEDFFKYTTTMNEGRQKRQAWAVNAFGEVLGKFLIPDPPQDPGTKRPAEVVMRDIWVNDGASPRAEAAAQRYGKG